MKLVNWYLLPTFQEQRCLLEAFLGHAKEKCQEKGKISRDMPAEHRLYQSKAQHCSLLWWWSLVAGGSFVPVKLDMSMHWSSEVPSCMRATSVSKSSCANSCGSTSNCSRNTPCSVVVGPRWDPWNAFVSMPQMGWMAYLVKCLFLLFETLPLYRGVKETNLAAGGKDE